MKSEFFCGYIFFVALWWQGHKNLFAFSAMQKIKDRLGQTLGGDARPRRI